ncbi:MAG: class I SAM-dependent methyltransferase, partial [Magnetococcales bacterium]|nr:class I SAM-dependent methyltransferase [Magnetococcales bacterium]
MIDLEQFAAGLQLDPGGIWRTQQAFEEISYPETRHQELAHVEDNSYWFRHRCDLLLEIMGRFPPSGPLFDLGGGNGTIVKHMLERGYEAVVVEPILSGAVNARLQGVPTVICATVESAGFHPGSLPAVGLFDVLEHFDDDELFLRKIHALLRPGGSLYLYVPALPWLWSVEDAYVGHFRRYALESLCAKLRRLGFEISFGSYLFWFLVMPIFFLRVLPSRLGTIQGGKAERLYAASRTPTGLLGRL